MHKNGIKQLLFCWVQLYRYHKWHQILMHWYFSYFMVLAGPLASEGVCVCVWKEQLPSGVTSPHVKRDHSHIGGHRRLCVPPLECSVYRKVLNYGVVMWWSAFICAIGPSNAWQLPPTTFWWPAASPRPRSFLSVFYGPGRGSPWSCPSRLPVRGEQFCCYKLFLTAVNPNMIYEEIYEGLTALMSATGATVWRNFTTHLHYFVTLL